MNAREWPTLTTVRDCPPCHEAEARDVPFWHAGLDGGARVREDRSVRDSYPTSWRRVCVVGPGGAGKSQLARQLAVRLRLPVVHLDQEYWHPGWVKTPEDQWRTHVGELASRPRWIMDGNYGSTFDLRFPTSDAVIFLDMPRRVTLPRVAYRRLANRGRSRPDMTPGCSERLSLEFLAWLWRYPHQSRPLVMQALKDHAEHATVVHLRSPREVTDWWRSIN